MKIICEREGILGKIEAYYAEGNHVWIYDGISRGLYVLDLNTKKVEMLLNPMQIHKDKRSRVRGIIKTKNRIVLVPQTISEYWIIYEIVTRDVKYIHFFDFPYQVGYVGQKNDTAYLVPLNTTEPIFMISLENLKCIKKIERWYPLKHKKDEIYECFAPSVGEEYIFIPIVHTNHIYKIGKKQGKLILVDTPVSIHSASIDKDSIWILPEKGGCIYQVNQSGNIIKDIDLFKEYELDASQFTQIVSAGIGVFLLPYEDQCIYVYKKVENYIAKIDLNTISCWEKYMTEIPCAYWGNYYENGVLHMLPMRYEYLNIDVSALETCEDELMCGETFTKKDYKDWCFWVKKNCEKLIFFEQTVESIQTFISCVSMEPEDICKDCESRVGEKIWNKCK